MKSLKDKTVVVEIKSEYIQRLEEVCFSKDVKEAVLDYNLFLKLLLLHLEKEIYHLYLDFQNVVFLYLLNFSFFITSLICEIEL